MPLNVLEVGESWMTEAERRLARELVRDLRDMFRARGIAENALLGLRVSEVVVAWLLARRLELNLGGDDTAVDPPPATPAQTEAIGKHRERLRKAIKELEDRCACAAPLPGAGIADVLKPLTGQADPDKD